MKKIREDIFDLVKSITPIDQLEHTHIEDVKQWISSGAEIFRISKPDTPPKHLVSYFLLIDLEKEKILLVHHRKAGLWLPAGGHVELEEHPTDTVKREIKEELGIEAEFLAPLPIFCTVTQTVGFTAGHTDVSLWYTLKGNSTKSLDFDESEFSEVQWFSLDNIPFEKSDPHMERFIHKVYASDDKKFVFNSTTRTHRGLRYG